jgi:DNA helicase-2/ATP-dependent DNA helicase PcrA
LRVTNQPDNNDALARIINTPSRRIGEATIKDLLEEADEDKITLWSLILGNVQGKRTSRKKIKNNTLQALSSFASIILTARSKMTGPLEERLSTVGLIKYLLKKLDYEQWLLDHHGDVHKARWDNVQELITQATDFQDLVSFGYEDDTLPEIDGLEQQENDDQLSRFLANVALASEVKKEDEEGAATAQVTISTIHAAKGLEWPVVFIPAIYQGSIPHSRAEDSNEERRLLYVAMTRAKALLYMSYPTKSSQGESTILSPFLAPPSLAPLLDQRGPSLLSSTVQTISQILRRPLPTTASISISSSSLASVEDDLFPIEGEEDENEKESRWNSLSGNPTFSMGQQAPKRRRVELGRSTSNLEEGVEKNWKPQYATTMERASSFTSAALTSTMGFVSAGSHLQILKEQSVNFVGNLSQDTETSGDQAKRKLMKQNMKRPDGQGTLMSFLGKPEAETEPEAIKRSTTSTQGSEISKPRQNLPSNAFHMARKPPKHEVSTAINESIGIEPSLANHRVCMGAPTRPRQSHPIMEQETRNDYIFLSSSPTRPKEPIPREDTILECAEALITKPRPLPLIRPATSLIRPAVSMHETSISLLQKSTGLNRTLGVKRSMNGWSSRKRQGFVPPTMKRPG